MKDRSTLGETKLITRYQLEPAGVTFGAVVRDIDLAAINEHTARCLVDDLHTHRLLVIPGQKLDHDKHVRVSRAFGTLDTNVHPQFTVPGHPEILIISNIFRDGQPIGVYDGDDEEKWHADHSWKPQMSSASLLYAEIAPAKGGETRFADTTAAYEELPDQVRERIEGLQAVHSMAHLIEQQNDANDGVSALQPSQVQHIPDVVHPLVRDHPVTGLRSLLLGSMIISEIVDLDEAETCQLLDELHAHATANRYVYTHHWSIGDLVIWDYPNSSTDRNTYRCTGRCCPLRHTPQPSTGTGTPRTH